jgi:hypothetical protein
MNSPLLPQIGVRIKLLSTARGGRSEPIPGGEYQGNLSARGQHFSFRCEMPAQGLQPGTTTTLDVQFLFPHLALPFFKVRDEFNLWEGGTIGYGRVMRLLAP